MQLQADIYYLGLQLIDASTLAELIYSEHVRHRS